MRARAGSILNPDVAGSSDFSVPPRWPSKSCAQKPAESGGATRQRAPAATGPMGGICIASFIVQRHGASRIVLPLRIGISHPGPKAARQKIGLRVPLAGCRPDWAEACWPPTGFQGCRASVLAFSIPQ